jgi:hypothetical protein
MYVVPSLVTTVTLHLVPVTEPQEPSVYTVLLAILTVVAVSCRHSQAQAFINLFGGSASADPESASVAATAAEQANVRRRRGF